MRAVTLSKGDDGQQILSSEIKPVFSGTMVARVGPVPEMSWVKPRVSISFVYNLFYEKTAVCTKRKLKL